MQEETYSITEHSLWGFLQEVQSAVKQGYVLSEDNLHFPQAFISLYTATLVKEEVPEDELSVESESIVVEVGTVVADVATEDIKVAEDTTEFKFQNVEAYPTEVRQNQTNLGRKKVR